MTITRDPNDGMYDVFDAAGELAAGFATHAEALAFAAELDAEAAQLAEMEAEERAATVEALMEECEMERELAIEMAA